jgi:hypothetical protein
MFESYKINCVEELEDKLCELNSLKYYVKKDNELSDELEQFERDS